MWSISGHRTGILYFIIGYLRKLQVKRNEVRIAVYPDYVLPHKARVNLSPLKSIEFVVQEALRYDFDGIDITGYVLRRNKDRKNSSLLKERVKELIIKVKQKRITDFTVFQIAEVRKGL
jgi:hypothetical protein